MGGLAALFLRRGARIDPQLFQQICTAVPYRTIDGIRTWTGDAAAVAKLRFVTGGADDGPAVDDERQRVIAFDGRLDNREELLDRFGLDASTTDAALALEAVARFDVDGPATLLGDFAFVAWDDRARRLLLARDHLGIRPLHYTRLPDRIICGTDVAHVLADPSVPRRANTRVVAEYLACAIRNGSETLYESVRRVPPGHTVVIDGNVERVHRYWSAEPTRRIVYRFDEEYAAHCRDLLVRSVSARMRGPSRLAATLSGGIDSSAVAIAAHRLVTGGPQPALFSMVFPQHPEADERPFIEAVAAVCGVTPVYVEPAPPARSLAARAIAWMNAPSMASDAMAEGMWNAMRDRGFRVALTGAGGDFAYAGSIFHYADLLRSGQLLALLRRYRDDRRADDTGKGAFAWLQAGLWPALPIPVKRSLRPLARRVAARGGLARSPSWLRLPVEREPLPEHPRGNSFAVEDILRGLTGGLHSFFLEGSERAAAEAHLEFRHPLLDVRLTEFVLAVPEDQRRRGPILKYVLRRALAGELPEPVASRTTKADFSHCVWDALEVLGGEAFFRTLAVADAGWVDAGRVRELYRRMRSEVPRGAAHYGSYIPELWMLAAIELWVRATSPAA